MDLNEISRRVGALNERAEFLKRSYSRYPKGSKKGGQFAPKAGGSDGGQADDRSKPQRGPQRAMGKPTGGKAPRTAKPASVRPYKPKNGKSIEPDRIMDALEKNKDFRKLTSAQRSKVRQTYATASSAFPEFESEMFSLAEQTKSKALFPPIEFQKDGTGPLKGVDRAMEKIVADYEGNADKINDLIRATIEVPNVQSAEGVVAQIRKNYKVIDGKSRNFLTQDITPLDGYRDAKFVVVMKSGARAEIQVNVPQLIEVKNRVHALYEERSALERKWDWGSGDRVAPPIPKNVLAEIESYNRKMRDAYVPVWSSLLKEVVKRLLKASKSIIYPFL